MNATIQARADYISKFGTYRYRVEIVDSQQDAENVRAYEITPQGAIICYEGDEENAFQPVISSTCTFTLVCTTQAQVDFLRTVAQSESGRYGVRILRANLATIPVTAHWVGTILADQLTFMDSLPQQVTVTATDDLGYLQDKPYLQTNGNRYEGAASVVQHVLNCINTLRTNWYWSHFIPVDGTNFFPIALSMGKNLLPANYSSAGAGFDLYDEARISHAGFHELDTEDKAKSAYYVLEEIAKHFNGQFFFTYGIGAPRLVFQPVGAQLQFAQDSTQIQGFSYRADGAVYLTSALPISTKDINNSETQKRRLAGGQFSYTLPYHKVKRDIRFADINPFISTSFNEASDFFQEFTFPLQPETGDRFRIYAPFTIQWGGVSADFINTVQNLPTATPDNFNIGRIRIRMRVRLQQTGNDYFLKRGLTPGGQVPIYQTWGDLTASDLPVYYTNLYPNVDGVWDNDGTEDFYVVVSEPFDPTVDQFIQIPFDVVTPSVPANASSFSVLIQATYLLPTNGNLINASLPTDNLPASNNFLTTSATCSVYADFKVFPFDDYGLDEGIEVTATNTEDNRRELDIGDSLVNDRALNSNFAVVQYRQGNGAYQANVLGYTSLLQSTSQNTAADIAVQEAAGLYKKARFKFDGSLIQFPIAFSDVLAITDGTTDYKLKPLTLEINTGEEVQTVAAMEIAAETDYPVVVQSPLGGMPIVTPAPSASATTNLSSLLAFQGEASNAVISAYSAAAAVDRSAQTNNNVVLIDSNGAFQEVTDGSNGQVLTTDGQGRYNFTTVSGGSSAESWHGYDSVILYPSAFVANDDGTRGAVNPEVIEDDTSLTLGVRSTNAITELYAFAPIPNGYKATQIIVYASASTANAVRTFTFNYSTGAITSNTNGAFNSVIDITDITGSTVAAVAIKVIPGNTTTIIYGARISIATV